MTSSPSFPKKKTCSKSRTKRAHVILHIYKVFSLLACMLIFCWQFRERNQLPVNRIFVAIILYMILLYKLEKETGGYSVDRLRISAVIFSKWISLGIAGIVSFVIELVSYGNLMIHSHLICFCLSALFTLGWACLGNKLARSLIRPLKTVVVYDENHIWDVQYVKRSFPKHLKVIGRYDFTQGFDRIIESAENAEAFYLCKIPSDMRNDLLKFATAKGVFVYIQPRLGDLILNSTKRISAFNPPVLWHNSRDFMNVYYIGKRIFDIVGSLLMLIVTLPILIVVAMLIKIDDRGPVFYTQVRLTKDRKEFKLIKFRSMSIDAEIDGVPRLASKDDPRVTRVGKWLRKTRIDELPQFINVLKGEMSIVGPRPERPEIAAQYEEVLPEFALRLITKAGITGYAQIYGKYNTEPYDKLQMDLMYILNRSLWEDAKLILMTLSLVLAKGSTEGVDAENVTAIKRDAK